MTDEHDITDKLRWPRVVLAVAEIGSCLTDLGNVIVRGEHADTIAQRGNISIGLERAASYVRGEPFLRYSNVEPHNDESASAVIGAPVTNGDATTLVAAVADPNGPYNTSNEGLEKPEEKPAAFAVYMLPVSIDGVNVIEFDYVNHRGEKGHRRAVIVEGPVYSHSRYHGEAQWLLRAYDLDKDAIRLYAMRDMTNVRHNVLGASARS